LQEELVKRSDRVKQNIMNWIEEIDQQITDYALKNNWSIFREFARKSPSRYLKLKRQNETIIVRISDHKSIYKTETFSLSPDGFDDSIDDVMASLAPRKDEL
jgi:hypothetical protein